MTTNNIIDGVLSLDSVYTVPQILRLLTAMKEYFANDESEDIEFYRCEILDDIIKSIASKERYHEALKFYEGGCGK